MSSSVKRERLDHSLPAGMPLRSCAHILMPPGPRGSWAEPGVEATSPVAKTCLLFPAVRCDSTTNNHTECMKPTCSELFQTQEVKASGKGGNFKNHSEPLILPTQHSIAMFKSQREKIHQNVTSNSLWW